MFLGMFLISGALNVTDKSFWRWVQRKQRGCHKFTVSLWNYENDGTDVNKMTSTKKWYF